MTMLLLVLLAAGETNLPIAQLGSSDPETRVQARRAILDKGGKAVPALWSALTHEDIEVRRSVVSILDALWRSSTDKRRRNPAYRFPFDDAAARPPAQRLGWLRREDYSGVLSDWTQPSLADYNGLLLSLGRMMRLIPQSPVDYTLASRACLRKLAQIGPSMRADWRTRWVVWREVLPGLEDALTARGEKITDFECGLMIGVLQHAILLPDAQIKKKALALRAGVYARLGRPSKKKAARRPR